MRLPSLGSELVAFPFGICMQSFSSRFCGVLFSVHIKKRTFSSGEWKSNEILLGACRFISFRSGILSVFPVSFTFLSCCLIFFTFSVFWVHILQIYCVFLLYEAFQMQKFLELLYLNRDGQKNEAFQSIRTSNPKHTKIRKASTEYKSLITFYTTRYLSHISQSEAENLLAVRLQIFHIPSVSYHTMGEKHAARRSTERTNGQVNICFDHAK